MPDVFAAELDDRNEEPITFTEVEFKRMYTLICACKNLEAELGLNKLEVMHREYQKRKEEGRL